MTNDLRDFGTTITACNPSQNDDGGNQTIYGERALWRAVITQALMDVASNSTKTIDKVERARATAWFSLRNPDFITVCHCADLDPIYVLQQAKAAISRGCSWRKESARNQLRKQQRHTAQPDTPNTPPSSAQIISLRGI